MRTRRSKLPGDARRRTGEYQDWVEAFARNHDTPIECAEKGVRKEDYVQRWLRPLVRAQRYGVYFISCRHGAMPADRLYASPFTDIHAQGPDGVSAPKVVQQLFTALAGLELKVG